MCDYCRFCDLEAFGNTRTLTSLNLGHLGEIVMETALIVESDEYSIRLIAKGKGVAKDVYVMTGFVINYCPRCGRKLKEDADD